MVTSEQVYSLASSWQTINIKKKTDKQIMISWHRRKDYDQQIQERKTMFLETETGRQKRRLKAWTHFEQDSEFLPHSWTDKSSS